MIGKLFTQRLFTLLVLLTFTSGICVNAQTTVITTVYPNDNIWLITGATGGPHAGQAPRFISFEIQNDNPCPVALRSVSAYHPGSVQFNRPNPQPPFFISANDSSYRLYGSYTNLSGSPVPITSANGWNLIAQSDTINTGVTNGITSLFNGLNVFIPANSKMRFILECTDTMLMHMDMAPLSFTSNGVTLVSGSQTNTWGGWVPGVNAASAFNATNFTPQFVSINFVGSITVEQLPPTTPVADNSIKPAIRCLDQMVTLKATHPKPGGTFTWKDKNGNIIAQNTTGTHQLGPLTHAHAGRYYVTYTLCGKESLPDSGTIIVSDPPAPTVSGKFDYCLNEQFEYTVVNGTNPIWYYTPTGGSPVPVTPTINTSSPNTLIYYVSQTDQYGCESQTRTMVRYRAAPKPEKPIVNTPLYYCEEMPAEPLTAIGDTLRWYYFPVGGVPTINAPLPNTSKDDSFQYYVTQTIDGCESDRARIDVVVTFRPNGEILLLHPETPQICAQDSIVIGYYGSAFVGSQYNWKLPERGTTILNGGFDQGPISLRLDTPGTQRITLRVGHTGCLSSEYELEVKVSPLPYGMILTKYDVCLGQAELIEMVRYTPDLDTFIWNWDGGTTTHYTTEQGPYGVFWGTEGEKKISVTLVNEGCVATITDSLMVHPKPSAAIRATHEIFDGGQNRYIINDYKEGDEICAADSLKVTVDMVEPGATYKWTPTRFFDTYSDQPVTYARVDFDSKIYVEVEDVYGCQNKDSLEVTTKPCCEMTFPNAFSPNGDGRNDLFRPITVGRREVKSFQVFNRYGQLVFESKQAQRGWDGTMNGRTADIGTYFYQITFVCGKENLNQSGEVILVR